MTLLEMRAITSRFSRLGVTVRGYHIGGQPVLVGVRQDTGETVGVWDGSMSRAADDMRQWAAQVYGDLLEREAQDWRMV